MDDLTLDGHEPTEDGLKYGWEYAQTWGSNQVRQAQFFGLRALTGSQPTSDKPEAFARYLGYSANPFTPWGGLTKSLAKIYTGQQDESSVQSAILSQLPILQPLLGVPGPKLNYLGDQIGNQPEGDAKKLTDRLEYAGLPIYLGFKPAHEDEGIYKFLLEKGVSPSLPLRSELETKNGWIPDESWADYVKYRGELIKTALRKGIGRMETMTDEDREKTLEKISRDSTKSAKSKMGLK
jgi:hypothetical protein